MTGAIDLLQHIDPSVKKLAFLFENSKFAKSVASAVKSYAESKGYQVVYEQYYPSGATEFTTYIAQIAQSGAEALLGGGHFQDGQSLAQQLYQQKPPLKAVFILVAPTVPEFANIGDAALGVMGPSQWESIAPYSPDQASKLGLEWYGPTIDEFVKAYKQEYNVEPGYHAAGGYVAGLVLQYAIEKAGTTNPDQVKKVLDSMHILIFWGEIKFSDKPENHGLQVAHEMILIQWQKVNGKLERVVVWPAKFAKSQPLYPIWG
jgi:branched-chain amino acid transport system substrate-binding protein